MTLKTAIPSLLFCMLACAVMQPAFAQYDNKGWLHSVKPTTHFDQRFYYLPAETQNVWGYRVGALINNKFKLGIGGYYMTKSNTVLVNVGTSGNSPDEFNINKKLYLGTIYYEPFLIRRNLWEASLVVETGYGRAVNTIIDNTLNKTTDASNTMLIPAGAGLSLNLKLPALFHLEGFRWIGVNIMGGYRTTLYREITDYDYSAPYWSFSGAIFFDKMLDDLQQWKKEKKVAWNKKAIEMHY